MPNYPLTLETICKLDDGRVSVAVKQAIARCLQDCMDRPGVTEPRTVLLQMEVQPIPEDSGEAEAARFKFQVKDKLPTRKSKVYVGSLRKGGHLTFNVDADDSDRQRSLLDGTAAVDGPTDEDEGEED